MKYDFTSIMDRMGKDAIAVEALGQNPMAPKPPKEGFDVIPMWVADMNFPTVPTIPEAIIERAKHPAYGYFSTRKEYLDSIIKWHETRNDVTGLTPECIGYENGVLGILSSALEAFSASGEPILVQSPCYIGFIHTLNNLGRKIIDSPLKKEDNWAMDYEDIEKKIIKHNIHFAIFCSPHNPTGRVWKKEEIQKFMDICKKHDVLVFSDEIWSDLVRKENTHIPTQSISEDAKKRTIAGYAPSKTFNLAGLVGSYHIVYDKYLRDRLNKQASLSHYNSPNILSVHALMGAYCKEGLDWVNELNEVISNNIDYALDFIHNNFKGIEVIKPEGTYMLYLDCTKYLDTHDITMDELLKKGVHYGVCWQDGRPFMNPNTIRMNLALPTILVEEAFSRLRKFVF